LRSVGFIPQRSCLDYPYGYPLFLSHMSL